MGLANWVVGRMVDAYLAQPAEEKAAVFDTMATKFWDAATPEEIAQISGLLLPRFMEHFLDDMSAEQKLAMMQQMFDQGLFEKMAGPLMTGLVEKALSDMSPETMKGFFPAMPGFGGTSADQAAAPDKAGRAGEPRPKRSPPMDPGGMLPW